MKGICCGRTPVLILLPGRLIFALGAMATTCVAAQTESASSRSVPIPIAVEAGNEPFARYSAIGAQQYVCLPKGQGFAWTLFAPQATLFDDKGNPALAHFLSGNPHENHAPEPTWQNSRDGSAVWGNPVASSLDPHFVALDAIPWLLLRVAGAQPGPHGGDLLKQATYIQRINTAGGVPPGLGCKTSDEVGTKALVPYTADYVFYRLAAPRRKP